MISLVPLFLAGAYVGWNIGANDAGNCIGTSVGCGFLSYRRAILLVAVFAILGGLFQGQNVMHTIGKGIVTTELPDMAILVALVSGGAFVTLATLFKLPVSTSEAIVGAMLGIGLATGSEINLGTLGKIAQVWVVCPILVAIMAVAINVLSRALMRRWGGSPFWQRLPEALLALSACYISFSLGANHVGTAMGPLASLGIPSIWLVLLGGGALALGALTFGSRVTHTVGRGIGPLDVVGAFSAQIAAALAVHFFSILGIPVSTSQSIVGAVIGVGLLHGIRTVRLRKIGGIVVGWVATPTAAGLFSFGLYKLLMVLTNAA